MSQCSCKNCDLEVFENSDKCIFHCEKNVKNLWLFSEIDEEGYNTKSDYENAKERWNVSYLMSFWEKFNNHINNIDGDIEIEYYIFPIYWVYQYQHVSIIEVLKNKRIRFVDCLFLDYFFLENLNKEKKELKRISFIRGCIFSRDVKLNNLYITNGITILNSTFKKKLSIVSCQFDYMFEVVNSSLIELNIIDIKTKKSIEVNYNLKNKFDMTIYIGNINEIKISGNNLNNLRFENIKINKVYIDDKHYELINYIFNKIEISENSKINNLTLENVKVNEYLIIDSNIEEKSLMKKSKFIGTLFNNTKFSGITDFSEVEFSENVSFKLCSFDEVIFRNSKFFKELDLCDISFYKDKIFLGIKANMANRETARIIKDSFEKQNNIIEANKFYALEMKEREKELSWGKNFFEKLVFTLHGMSSDHSQSWLLALFWIINLSFITSFLGEAFSNEISTLIKIDRIFAFYGGLGLLGYFISQLEKIRDWLVVVFSFCIYLVYENYSNDKDLACFSKTLNPFSIMRGDEPITFGGLIYKIIIAYLIYQLIISIRQNTRRK